MLVLGYLSDFFRIKMSTDGDGQREIQIRPSICPKTLFWTQFFFLDRRMDSWTEERNFEIGNRKIRKNDKQNCLEHQIGTGTYLGAAPYTNLVSKAALTTSASNISLSIVHTPRNSKVVYILKQKESVRARTWFEKRPIMNTTRYKSSLFRRNPDFHIRIGHLNIIVSQWYKLRAN